MANVYTILSNTIWYTDKCSISTGGTAVTYQVYATALGNATAAGNIYSGPPEIGANEIKQIYVGVGNYITVTGSNYMAQEIGGQTSAQAGTGPFTENLIPVVPTQTYVIASQPGAINSGSSGTFDITTTGVADSTTLYWTINNVTSVDADFTAVSGSFVIASNAGVFEVTTVSGIESNVTFTASIRTGSIAGTVVDTSESVTINLDPVLLTLDGSTLTGWTIVGVSPTIDAVNGDPAPSWRMTDRGMYRNLGFVHLNKTFVFDVRPAAGADCGIEFANASSGTGPYRASIRIRQGTAIAGQGIATGANGGWLYIGSLGGQTTLSTFATANAWYTVKLRVTSAGVCTWFVNDVEQSGTITLNAGYTAADTTNNYFGFITNTSIVNFDTFTVYDGIV